MKRILCIFLSLFLLPLFSAQAADAENGGQIALYIGSNQAIVNDVVEQIDANLLIVPLIKNSSAFVPVRFIAESLGMDVEYIGEEQKVVLSGSGIRAEIKIGENTVYINGTPKMIDPQNATTKTFIHKGRTYLPVRILGEAIGKGVFYDRGLIVISDSARDLNPNTHKEEIDEMINRLNTLMIVGDMENLKSLLEAGDERYYFSKDMVVREWAGAAAAPAPAAESHDDYSKTNIQVEGVDEADIVKTDGEYIYSVNSDKIIITRINPPDEMSVLSVISDTSMVPQDMYVDGNTLVVISYITKSRPYPDAGIYGREEQKMIAPPYFYQNTTRCSVYEISDRSNPFVLREFDIEGSYISSRKIGSTVYLVTNKYAYFYSNDPIVPMVRDTARGEDFKEIPLDEISYFPGSRENNFITVTSIDTFSAEKPAGSTTILGAGQNIYVSAENMYIASTRYDWEATTNIYKFALNDGAVSFTSRGSVPGSILNQFSMDEYNGAFRIATTSHKNGQPTNNLYVLDESLNRRGSITDIAPGEQIYSTRFMGDRGYMVTFQLVDPLFVLDLSDIDNPKILGKLKIPGYSNYLHPVDENHVIGFGKDAEVYKNGAYYQGMKMALFDITDVSNPVEKYVEVIGGRGSDSPLLYNHRALLYDYEKRLLAFPVTVYSPPPEGNPTQYGTFEFQGAYVYDFGLDTGFTLKGKISHVSEEDYLKMGNYYPYNKGIERILYANGSLFTISPSGIFANRLDDVEFISKVDFEEIFEEMKAIEY